MDRSVSWTDPKNVAALLSRASGAVQKSRPRTRSAPPPVDRSPPPAVVVQKPAPPKEVPPLQQVSDNPSDRMDALIAWTLDHFPCTGAFVADDNGLTLAAHGISEAHVALVGPMLWAMANVRTIPGIDATAGALLLGVNMMSWVEGRSDRGGFCLGTVGEQPLSTKALEQLKAALEVTVGGL
ncbi:MAG TPA: hypothetical protein VMI54_01230 [Polyangiaceae bacterium]|nr:hypothetical protein [Polyangiaceae bacterium]